MKKVLLFAACAIALTACKNEKAAPEQTTVSATDSLQRIIEQKDNEINDMMGLLNDVEEGFRDINAAENRVLIAKDGEGSNKESEIRENIRFIQQRLVQNRELIEKLRQQMRESSFKGEQLKRTIENLVKQLDNKDIQYVPSASAPSSFHDALRKPVL